MVILAIDLAKARSLFCWHDVVKGSHRMKTIASTPQSFHEALTREKVERVIIEVCDMAGWIKDLCDSLQIPIQIANGNTEGWRWRNVIPLRRSGLWWRWATISPTIIAGATRRLF